MSLKTLYDRIKLRITGEPNPGESDADLRELAKVHQQLLDKYETLTSATETIVADRDKLKARVVELEAQVEQLRKTLFGRRSEKRNIDINYDQKLFEDPETEPPTEEEQEVIDAE